MNSTQLQSKLAGLTGTASKVYDAVPIGEKWHVRQVIAEMAREGHSYDFARISGCLRSLAEQGLIQENPAGFYRKDPPPVQKPTLVRTAPMPQTAPTEAKKETALDTFGCIANELRAQATLLNEQADALEEAALAQAQKYAKLDQLRNLMKGALD